MVLTKSIQLSKEKVEEIASLAERLDFLDIVILRKFYIAGKDFPNDIRPYCFPLLYKEMKEINRIKIGPEALRKRLNNLVKLGLLEKIKSSNPSNYSPIRGLEELIRSIIAKFFLLSGITKYLEKSS